MIRATMATQAPLAIPPDGLDQIAPVTMEDE